MYTGYVTKYLCAADACLSFEALPGDLKRLPEPINHTAAGLNSTFSHNICKMYIKTLSWIRCSVLDTIRVTSSQC